MSEARETADLYPSVVEGVGSGTGNFYRTGTFTPILSDDDATVAGATIHTGTPAIQAGFYQRTGDIVHINFYYKTPASYQYTNGSDGTGQLEFHGLPFTIDDTTHYYPAALCGYFAALSGWAAGYTPMGIGVLNTKKISVYLANTNTSTAVSSGSHSGSNSSSIWSMTYLTKDA